MKDESIAVDTLVTQGEPTHYRRLAGRLLFRVWGPHYVSGGVEHIWWRLYRERP